MAQNGAHKIEWFGKPGRDERFLEMWRDIPVNYRPGDPTGSGWAIDDHEEVVGHDDTDKLFRIAADRLMQYLFYPPSLMQVTSDFGLARRWLKQGDRLIQRVCVLRLFGRPVLELLTMNEVYDVIDLPRIKGFTYITTQGHSEKGEWSAHVEWTDANEVVARMHAISTAMTGSPAIARRFQISAHQRGMAWFTHQMSRQRSDFSKKSDL